MLLDRELEGAARWFVPLLVFAGVAAAGFFVRMTVLRALGRWSARTETKFDDAVLTSVRWPSLFWVLILALLVAFQVVNLPGDTSDVAVRRALAALLILSITLGASRFLGEMVQLYRSEVSPELAIASTGLLRTVVRVAVLVTGLLVMLATLGINVAPILGALGVGGLAAGLALQPTLSNLFAGFQIAMARQVRVGHRVRLSSGEEGWVHDIAWRTTTLRTPTNHLIIVPNSKFADSIITNFNLPDPPAIVSLDVRVPYDADPRRVEAILLDEVKQAIQALPELVRDYPPTVRLQSFGESSLEFRILVQARDFDAQFEPLSELRQRVFARLRGEGIPVPFPTRIVYLHGEANEAGR